MKRNKSLEIRRYGNCVRDMGKLFAFDLLSHILKKTLENGQNQKDHICHFEKIKISENMQSQK